LQGGNVRKYAKALVKKLRQRGGKPKKTWLTSRQQKLQGEADIRAEIDRLKSHIETATPPKLPEVRPEDWMQARNNLWALSQHQKRLRVSRRQIKELSKKLRTK